MNPGASRQADIIGVPLDLGAGRRGVDMGPSAFRLTGLAGKIRALGFEVHDRGNVPGSIPEGLSPGDPRKRYVKEIAAACREVHALTAGGIHLSLDLDGLDPEVAPGVGTPVRGGLSYREAHLLCETIAASGLLVGMDVAELNPTLDVRNHSAEVGAELILSALGQRIL